MVQVVGKDQSAVKRTTCRGCASILEYTLSEVSRGFSSDYTGGTDYYNYIRCPVCSKEVYVKGY